MEKFLTVIPRPTYFVGRKRLLASIQKSLTKGNNVVLIHGLGGIGKTTTILQYIHDFKYNSHYDHIAFFEVSTNIQSSLASNRNLQIKLGIDKSIHNLPPDQYYSEGARVTLEALSNLGEKVLLVFDHVNNRKELFEWKPIFRNLKLHCLLISRASIPGVVKIKVNPLTESDSFRLFLYHSGKRRKDLSAEEVHALEEILSYIDRHTLLLEMLAFVSQEAKYTLPTLRDYLKQEFIRHRELQRTVSTSLHGESYGIPESTISAYVRYLFIDLLNLSEREKNLLSCLAALPAKTYVANLLFELFMVPESSHTRFLDELAMIHKKGLPIENEDGYAIHPILRDVVLQLLPPQVTTSQNLISSITEILRLDPTKDNPINKFPQVEYGLCLLEIFKKEKHPELSEMMSCVSVILRYMGKFQESVKWGKNALILSLKYLGEGHPMVADQRSNLADIYWELGMFAKARKLLEQALEADVKNFGEDHPNVATRLSSLGCVYRILGELELARNYLERALKSDQNNFKKHHPIIARSQLNLVYLYYDLKEYIMASELLEDVLISYTDNFGSRHPYVISCQSSLGTIYLKLGNVDRAEVLIREALNNALETLGKEHPSIGNHKYNLACVLLEKGYYEESLRLLSSALDICMCNLSEKHPLIDKIEKSIKSVSVLIK